MTPRDLLAINGGFPDSPLIGVLRRLHILFTDRNIPYAVIGGLAVVRNGAPRTTDDIDVLTTREGWDSIRSVPPGDFLPGIDSAQDRSTGIQIDVLFAGDDWNMVFTLPHPESVSEFDRELGARFMTLPKLLELKTAVYLQKKAEDGIEIAAKDLSDVVELLRANRETFQDRDLNGIHEGVREELRRIRETALRKGKKGR